MIEIVERRPLEGYWQQILKDPAGRILEVSPWRKNLIVSRVGNLLAWFLKEGGTPSAPAGVQFYALGSGQSSWDITPVLPDPGDTELETEIAASRKAPAMTYLDAIDQPTATRTDKIELTVTYGSLELNGTSWREFGIFGGDATASPDTGYMINHVIHGVFEKTSAISVTRKTRFQF